MGYGRFQKFLLLAKSNLDSTMIARLSKHFHKKLQKRSISIFAALHGSSSNKKYRIFTSDTHLELHPQWLRERCLSPLSVQQETLQPLHQPHEFCWPMDIETAALTDDGTVLRLRFSDGHDSTFQVQDLEKEASSLANCGVQQKDNQMPTPILWTSADAEVMRIPYEDLVDGVHGEIQDHPDGIPSTFPSQIFKLTERLLTHGHVIVTNTPSNNMQVAAFAQALTQFQGFSSVRATNWGPVFNVRSEPDAELKDLAYTSSALSPHVDNPYRNPNPGFQLLHALENKCTMTGGSLAVDGSEVARQLREENPEMFRVLSTVACRWENDGGDKSTALVYFGPQISCNPTTDEVEQIRYSPKSGGYAPAIADPDEMDLLFRARRRFAELLNEDKNTVRFHLNEGDIWMFNNLRVLHGRDEFDVNEGTRHFQGCYIDVDGVQSAYFRSKYLLQEEAEDVEGKEENSSKSDKKKLIKSRSFGSSVEVWDTARASDFT